MNNFITRVFIVSLLANPVQALELGQIRLLSHLNEPFKANIDLGSVVSRNLADLHFSIAGEDVYQSKGLDKPFYLGGLNFKLISAGENQHYVQLSTHQRVLEPIVDLLVKVEDKQGSLTRLYTLMLDPGEFLSAPADNRPAQQTGQKKTALDTAVNVSDRVSRQPSQRERVSVTGNDNTSDTLWVDNESISIIAQNSPLHEKFSVYQIMRAFYLLNPQAFLHGNINLLQSASRLKIPDEAMVAEVPRQQAVNFVYAASTDNPFKKTLKQPDTQPKLARIEQKHLPAESASVAAPESTRPVVLKQNIRKDIQAWRNMADEFSNLSFIVQTQNAAIKTHGDVLKQMDRKQQQDDLTLTSIQQRLDALESAGLSSARSLSPAIVRSGMQSQNNALGDAENGIGDIRDMMEQINLRLQILEGKSEQRRVQQRELVISTKAEVVNKPATLSKPVVSAPIAPAVPDSNQERNWLLAGVLLSFVMLLLIAREIIWHRRVRSLLLQQTEYVDTRADDEPVGAQIDLAVEGEKSVIDSAVDVELKQTGDLNMQTAEDKYEAALASAQDFKLDSVASAEKDDDHERDNESLYAEIDILISYQLYEEARKLLQGARDNMPDNHCLDIRELEILACMREVELFIAKYQAQKAVLSSEFPEAWEKIEALHEEIEPGYPKVVTL